VMRRRGHRERADQHDAVDEVGAGHQRRVQHRRHLGDEQEPDEDGEREDECAQRERLAAAQAAAPASRADICSPMALPSCVMHVWATTTSSKSRRISPSLRICMMKRVTLCEYSWLAWPGTVAGRLVGPSTVTPLTSTSSSGRVYSQLPPAGAARSTTTEPCRMPSTMALVISTGAFLLGTNGVVITKSDSRTCSPITSCSRRCASSVSSLA